MTLRPCITCGEPADGTRCPEHAAPARKSSPKPSAHSRGYDAAWTKLSARARRLQPWCSDCGATEDLQADHTPEAWERKAAGKSIRLRDIDVVCGPCNRRRGAARPTAPQQTRPSRDPWGITPAGAVKTRRSKPNSALHTARRASALRPANTVTGTANDRAAS